MSFTTRRLYPLVKISLTQCSYYLQKTTKPVRLVDKDQSDNTVEGSNGYLV